MSGDPIDYDPDDYEPPDPFEGAPQKVRQRERDLQTKLEAFRVISGGQIACVDCGDDRASVLHVEHINNNGKAHRKALGMGGIGAGMRVWRWALRNPETARRDLELLCANCHCLRTSRRHVPPEYLDLFLDEDDFTF